MTHSWMASVMCGTTEKDKDTRDLPPFSAAAAETLIVTQTAEQQRARDHLSETLPRKRPLTDHTALCTLLCTLPSWGCKSYKRAGPGEES